MAARDGCSQSSERGYTMSGPEPDDRSTLGRDNAAMAGSQSTGMAFRVAMDLDDALAAWQMVYQAYRRKDLIDPNPHRLHTAPQAVGDHAVVILGCLGPVVVSTLTALADGPDGLPLDRVYSQELDALRDQGRTLIEVGLFADRRRHLARTAEALFQLMRYAYYYGLQQDMTDFVIGVHPRHARFYLRAFGFDYVGQEKVYPAVNDRPVVLLRGNIEENLKMDPLHPALAYFVQHPVNEDVFEDRFRFESQQIVGSKLALYLDAKIHPRADDLSASA